MQVDIFLTPLSEMNREPNNNASVKVSGMPVARAPMSCYRVRWIGAGAAFSRLFGQEHDITGCNCLRIVYVLNVCKQCISNHAINCSLLF